MSSTEMKSYLSLIPISAKVRRRQNRMTILCIVLAVFLVTAVFSMADMAIRMETSNQLNKNGNWHIMVKDISPETAAELAAQKDVAAFSAYSDINASLTENYFAGDKRAALVGADDAILQIFPGMQCSTAPADGEVLVTANIRDWLDVTVGTAIPLTLPDGQTISLTIAGFNEDISDANQYDAVVLVMNRSTFSQIATQVEESFETQYFIQFKPRTNLRQSIVNIENKYGISEEKISENTYLMALNASSNNDYIVGLYAVAAVLAGMVVLAGTFMITGSINSNVAQRTSYYGMLRCLGAGKIRFGCLSGWKLFSGVKLLFQQDVCWESFPHGDCVPFCVDLSARSSALYQCLASARSVLSVVPCWDLSRLVRGIFSGTAGGKSFSDHSSNWECGGKCSGFSVSCSVVWKSCRAFFGREPCNLVQKELASDDRFLCVKHSPVFELFGFASMGWICAESVAALHTGLIGG